MKISPILPINIYFSINFNLGGKLLLMALSCPNTGRATKTVHARKQHLAESEGKTGGIQMQDDLGNNVSTQLARLFKDRENFEVTQGEIAKAGGWSVKTVRLLEEKMKDKVGEKTLLRYRGALAAVLLRRGVQSKAMALIREGIDEAVVGFICWGCDGDGYFEDSDGDDMCNDCCGTGIMYCSEVPHPEDLEDTLD